MHGYERVERDLGFLEKYQEVRINHMYDDEPRIATEKFFMRVLKAICRDEAS